MRSFDEADTAAMEGWARRLWHRAMTALTGREVGLTVLILEALDAEVVQWLADRHDARFAPELVSQGGRLRVAIAGARALVAPPELRIDEDLLDAADSLRVIARVSGGAENIDFGACAARDIQLVRSQAATAPAEAEFAIGGLIAMLRRVPVAAGDGSLVGRELGCCTVGLVGLTPTAQVLASLLAAFGARVVGYDPALHPRDPTWTQWGIEALALPELVEQSDAGVVLLPFFERFRGLLGERPLSRARPGQVWMGLSSSAIFDETALAASLRDGRVRAVWFDSLEPGVLEAGRPLHGQEAVQVTPRLADTTRESRLRAAWSVARRIDALLSRDESAVPSGAAPLR
jgi:D-3-phosphoglycerate dehydrogenase